MIALPDAEREVEIAIPGRYDLSPNQLGLISTVTGVIDVAEM